MKTFVKTLCAGWLLVAAFSGTDGAWAQNSKSQRRIQREKEAEQVARRTDSLIRAREFLFVPSKALTNLPGKSSVDLTTYYEVAVIRDSLVCTLPYFGEVRTSQFDPTKPLLEFESNEITYQVSGQATGKKPLTVTIQTRPKGGGQLFTFIFSVFDNGSASLLVKGTGTQDIQYLGNLMAIPPKKEQ